MKKIKIFIFCMVFFLCFSFNVKAVDRCDIDSDGKITDNDSNLLNQILLEEIDSSNSKYYVADCNGDGDVNISDVVAIKKNIENAKNKVSCGNITNIPEKIPELTSFAVTLIQIAIPIVLILLGSIDLFKGITANKEDEIKKGQQLFIKRLITGALIFFIVIVVKFVISIVADTTTKENMVDCIDCFIDYESCGR